MSYIKRNWIGLLAAVVLVVIIGYLSFPNPTDDSYSNRDNMKIAHLTLGGADIHAWIADDELSRVRGLSGIASLADDEGMLFAFMKDDFYGIWMKEMLIPIDIIWMDKDFNIVYIEQSVSPDTYPKVFFPKKPTRYVLEIRAGLAAELGIKIGQAVGYLETVQGEGEDHDE